MTKTIGDVYNEACQVEAAGVPVDWKTLCLRVIQAATQDREQVMARVSRLEAEVADALGKGVPDADD